MPENPPLPILYSFRRCPYAMRARMALWYTCTPVELREVILRDKPPELIAASAKATVPVLVLPDGRVIDESYDIMKWALARCDPDGWLDVDIITADALVGQTDQEFKPNLDRYKYPEYFPQHSAADARTAGMQYLQTLDSLCEGRPFLLGDHISIVDVAIAPFVRQFAQVDPAWFAAFAGSRLNNWLVRFTTSTLFTSVMQKYPRWSPDTSAIVFCGRSSV